jgi:organic radical activating enzyme
MQNEKTASGLSLKVSEIFYSLQGEGGRAGRPSIFVRLQGCKAKHACAAMGIKCDTEFESGQEMTVESLLLKLPGKEIVWTGGEPTDQLTTEIVAYFKAEGFYQAIETSGLNPAPIGLDYICVSPKVAEHIVKKNFPARVDELRYVRHNGQSIPEPQIKATRYFLSPHFDGYNMNEENLRHCIDLCLKNPNWNLSVQNHKLWNVL